MKISHDWFVRIEIPASVLNRTRPGSIVPSQVPLLLLKHRQKLKRGFLKVSFILFYLVVRQEEMLTQTYIRS